MGRAKFWVEVEWEREQGKFASRDEIVEQITEALEGANPDQIDGVGADNDSIYNIIDWTVEELPQKGKGR